MQRRLRAVGFEPAGTPTLSRPNHAAGVARRKKFTGEIGMSK
jgi:hypothetical protein